jgi:hypothetical protein
MTYLVTARFPPNSQNIFCIFGSQNSPDYFNRNDLLNQSDQLYTVRKKVHEGGTLTVAMGSFENKKLKNVGDRHVCSSI